MKCDLILHFNIDMHLKKMSISVIRACTRSQVWVKYNIIPYTSTSIKLPHLCQGYHSHCIATSSDGGWEGWGCFIYVRFWVGARVGTQSTLVPAVLVGSDLAGFLREPAGTATQPHLLVGERRLFGSKQDFHDVPAVDAGRRRLNV